MKIKKLTASTITCKPEFSTECMQVTDSEQADTPVMANEKSQREVACDYIMEAIKVLAADNDDEVARDSIANLAVILLDLK